MNYKIVDMNNYYRKGVYEHFSQIKCSISMTSKIDVTDLYRYSKANNSKFYLNFLYLLCKTLNSRDDYKMNYRYDLKSLVVYEKINPTHYTFFEDLEKCTPVYSEYYEDYQMFYNECLKDIEKAKEKREYNLDEINHPNWFDASFIPWISYDSMSLELPDGYLYFLPIVNWGKFKEENNRLMMPVTIRLNHCTADGYLVSLVYKLLEKNIKLFLNN